ncbi:RagB/SusD family nutrient uptake outer membrane protein [Fulvivirgaceae bacterium BMA10]|uniref:RagB/SusD family nutrient uptake outer membrane protein n=1 Tax=Splendidivirga corallicola TaxID=3051826 RepID=A0ABT8KTG0_9BACT|nr:RagB/SusD family nutrient uptake outer membrane protein [Fulvivirgaceae bacterium BMA10]
MKIYKYLIAAVFVFSCLTACEDELELDPQQSLSDQSAFADGATAEGVLIGAYSLMQDLDVFGGMPQVVSDYMADNVNFVGTFPTLQDINNFNQLATNGSTANWFRDGYEAITSANLVIDNLPLVDDPNLLDADRARIIAEAKFIRAITYFHMINLFAQPVQVNGGQSLGLPLVLEAFTGEVTFPSRATVEEVHQQIMADLNAALPDLNESFGANIETRGRATQGAARALLSRLYLYRGEWQQAADLADQVISSSLYALAPDYTFYDQLTSEDVFVVVNSDQDNGSTGSGGWDNYYEGSDQNGRGDATFSQNLIDAFMAEPGDLRFDLKENGVDAQGLTSFFTTKFNDAQNDVSDSPIIRTTEMYLNRAEALAELNGVNQTSVDLINDLRTRAGLAAYTLGDFASTQELIDVILVERRKELCFEGHRRMDLLRRGLPLRTASSLPASAPVGNGISSPGDDKVIIPIPQNQVDLNPNLAQSPGY